MLLFADEEDPHEVHNWAVNKSLAPLMVELRETLRKELQEG